jgi:hypothetical protein
MDDERVLTLSHETRFDGLTEGAPETVRRAWKDRAEWEIAHRQTRRCARTPYTPAPSAAGPMMMADWC